MRKELIFKIDGQYRPDTIPLERLGDYLSELGKMLGEKANVHFEAVAAGSTIVHAFVDEVAEPKVRRRVKLLAAGEAPSAAQSAYARLDGMLRDDNSTGYLVSGTDNVIRVDFPGRNRPDDLVYGPIKQIGTLDGVVFRVEGRDATVHVGVMDGQSTYALEAPASLGHDLAMLFRSGPIRFRGEGTWYRLATGEWDLRKFKIEGFERLDDAPVSAAIDRLREIGLGGWGKSIDPIADLAAERDDRESEH